MSNNEMKQFVMDSVIEFFSGSVLDKVFTNEAIVIMNNYSIEWNNADASYDDPEGSEKLDKIIDDCVADIMKLDTILLNNDKTKNI